MEIDISKDETGEQLDVVFAVSVGLGSTRSPESAFPQRGLIAELQGAGHPLPPWDRPPARGKAPAQQAQLRTPDPVAWPGKTDSFFAIFPCFLLLLISKDKFSPTVILNSCFV